MKDIRIIPKGYTQTQFTSGEMFGIWGKVNDNLYIPMGYYIYIVDGFKNNSKLFRV